MTQREKMDYLHNKTNYGMMDCSKALKITNWDVHEAYKLLINHSSGLELTYKIITLEKEIENLKNIICDKEPIQNVKVDNLEKKLISLGYSKTPFSNFERTYNDFGLVIWYTEDNVLEKGEVYPRDNYIISSQKDIDKLQDAYNELNKDLEGLIK